MEFADTYYTISKHRPDGCVKACFPDLKSTQINAWISFAITRISLKELDLQIRIREPGELPPAIFMCETLEVLKIDVNLGLDQASTMPSFRLPDLKLLYLFGTIINDHGFLPRLISSCPLLEDLRVEVFWTLNISSLSLRSGSLPIQHSITNMDHLVEAELTIGSFMRVLGPTTHPLQIMLSLIKVFNNVQYLSLDVICTQQFEFRGVEDKLPVFDNLKYLELGYFYNSWDNVVLAFLNHSPVLETLVFPGAAVCMKSCLVLVARGHSRNKSFSRVSHLKRIEIDEYYGKELEDMLWCWRNWS
uniref:F-box/LRR-repeat protein 15/At3g58940/PEG3-like LRR domain-containing protein n=1 Tax=Chenopodium quinoa TaxID=63459 RepID=A0A803LIC2_CHEQI